MSDDTVGSVADDVLAARVGDTLARDIARPLNAGLYLVATPIGNLADITLRALTVLSQVDLIYAEDSRHSGRLLQHYGISKPVRSYHDHNAGRERPKIIEALGRGARLALVSDAGTPLVSDPGFKLVREVAAAGFDVVSIPGPSASLAALSCSGLATDTFLFAGFLPAKAGARAARLASLAGVDATLIFYESPSRVGGVLAQLFDAFGERDVVVARELTKLHEEVARGSLSELATRYAKASVKGECVILVGPPVAKEVVDADIEACLVARLEDMSLRDAAREVALELDVAKARVYELGLKLKNEKT